MILCLESCNSNYGYISMLVTLVFSYVCVCDEWLDSYELCQLFIEMKSMKLCIYKYNYKVLTLRIVT